MTDEPIEGPDPNQVRRFKDYEISREDFQAEPMDEVWHERAKS